MSSMNLQGQPGELRMTIEIKRKETGKVETFELVGHANNPRCRFRRWSAIRRRHPDRT